MILAIDIGNTYIEAGLMEGLNILRSLRLTTNKQRTDFEYAADLVGAFRFFGMDISKIDGAVMCCVVPPLTAVFSSAVEMAAGVRPLVVGKGMRTGVNILIDDPATVGADLIAAAAGALRLYRPPLIIVDMSTATTISVIDGKGSFIGGAISPGLTLGVSALASGTSQLPSIASDPPEHVIGTNTVDSMRSGSVIGAASMIDGMVERIEEELGSPARVIATGGMAASVAPLCRRDVEVNENLLLTGLAVIYSKNLKSTK